MKQKDIQDYYQRTYWDYRLVWTNGAALGCHFGYYDAGVRSHARALLRTNEVVAERAGVRAGARVLDAGCGLGGTALWLAAERGAEVLGLNLSTRQLERARRAARERGLDDRVRFACADFTAAPAPDGAFDAVIAIESLCHAEDKAAFVAEAARLLRRGGRLVVADYMRVRDARTPLERTMLAEWADGWTIAPLASPQDLTDAGRATGFDVIETVDVTDHMRRSLRRLYALTFLGLPISTALTAVGLRSARGHRNVVASRRQYEALRLGLWRYFHLVLVKKW